MTDHDLTEPMRPDAGEAQGPRGGRRKIPSRRQRGSTGRKRISAGRRLVFWVILILTPLVVLVAAEGLLRVTGIGAPPPLFRAVTGEGIDGFVTNADVGARYFPPAMRAYMPRLAFQYFPREKGPQTFRIFSLGGSSMAGFPYHAHGSITGLLETQIEHLLPGREIETVNCAMTAVNSHTAVDFLPEILEHEPDMILVYMGHNEFYGALGIGSISSLGEASWTIPIARFLLDLRLTGLLRGAFKIGHARRTAGKGRNVMETMAAEREIPWDSPLRKTAGEVFGRNLERLVQRCRREGVPILLCEVSSNLRAQPPFGSVHPPGFSGAEAVDQALERAATLEHREDLVGALAAAEEAVVRDSTFAVARFRRARLFEALGREADARAEYHAAREMDAVPFRAPAAINETIRRVASERGVALVAVDSLLTAEAKAGVPGEGFFLEHLHFRPRGNARVAEAIARELCRLGWIAAPRDWNWEHALSWTHCLEQAGVTELDLEIGDQRVHRLKQKWPYRRSPGPAEAYESARSEEVVALAGEFLEKKIELNEAHIRLGDSYRRQGEWARAVAEYRSAYRMFPLDPRPAMEMGELLLRMGYPAQGGRVLARILPHVPESERLFLLLAQALMATGSPDRAEAIVTRLLQLHPNSAAGLALRDSLRERREEEED
ncbi:MAG: tetratricopeptide repeat protein [Candidatus Eisenbacteria sp.]|nr:tetratricopeptide repeat protein [Candidatus Eisenbacteria bacterium]